MKDFERTLRELAAIKPGAESIIIDSSPPLAGLTEALRSLGYSREEAERRVARASETLGESASEEEILAEALRRAPAPASLSRDRRSAVRARRWHVPSR
jgi:Holliday junction resolvasome RuvABC DNA-binding subunit